MHGRDRSESALASLARLAPGRSKFAARRSPRNWWPLRCAARLSPGQTCSMETPDLQGAYPRLSDAQVAALTALGERRAAQPEEVLFREGQRNGDFFVVLAGNVAVVEARGTPEERTIAVHGRHRFLGELGLLTGEASYFTAVAADAGEVLAVPVERLRELVARDPGLEDLILRALPRPPLHPARALSRPADRRIAVLAGRQAAPRRATGSHTAG
jgi:CRP-like cAMP-binding protein